MLVKLLGLAKDARPKIVSIEGMSSMGPCDHPTIPSKPYIFKFCNTVTHGNTYAAYLCHKNSFITVYHIVMIKGGRTLHFPPHFTSIT